jgi:hypothetical protein
MTRLRVVVDFAMIRARMGSYAACAQGLAETGGRSVIHPMGRAFEALRCIVNLAGGERRQSGEFAARIETHEHRIG